jgi:hypothetical protein
MVRTVRVPPPIVIGRSADIKIGRAGDDTPVNRS